MNAIAAHNSEVIVSHGAKFFVVDTEARTSTAIKADDVRVMIASGQWSVEVDPYDGFTAMSLV